MKIAVMDIDFYKFELSCYNDNNYLEIKGMKMNFSNYLTRTLRRS